MSTAADIEYMGAVVEGEVVDTGQEVEVRVAALRGLPAESQVQAVTVLVSDAYTRMLAASAIHDLPGIRHIKAEASTLQEIAKQLRLGKEMQLNTAEFVRRVERALGVAIRVGQERGEVRSKARPGNQHRPPTEQEVQDFLSKPTPTDFANPGELHTGRRSGIYDMTDGVSDEQFDDALEEARDEGNLSRANVARKARAKAQSEPTPSPKPEPERKVRKTAAARKVMDDIAITVNSLVFVVNDTDPAEVDYGNHKADVESIFQGLAVIKKFLNKVKEQS